MPEREMRAEMWRGLPHLAQRGSGGGIAARLAAVGVPVDGTCERDAESVGWVDTGGVQRMFGLRILLHLLCPLRLCASPMLWYGMRGCDLAA